MVPFGGWEMPLSYPRGTLAEHRACRESAVAFDVSHLGTVRVAGAGAFETVNAVLTNDLGRIAPGRAQYTHLLDEADASVLDDIIVWWVGEDRFDVMPNASNTARVVGAVGGEDVTATRAIVAVQGPHARRRLQAVSPEGAEVPRFAVRQIDWRGTPLVVAGTGYTGEDGVEFAVPVEAAEDFWNAVLDAGVVPAGLGARDTLRLEAALPLHGHELGPGITPLQAGLGWVVAWNKGPFHGREALEEERRRGPQRLLAGLAMQGRQPPREGCAVMMDDGAAGIVTSGNFSPMLGHGIALAFLPPEVEVGTGVEVDVRNRPLPASVTKLPFLAKKGK